MIIELVGLPGVGKTYIADALAARGATVVAPRTRFELIRDALIFEWSHPFSALQIATYIVLHAPRGMRYTLYVNTYLGSAAKWIEARRLDRRGQVAVIDQGFAHIAVALVGMPAGLVRALPKPDRLVIVEAPDDVRQGRMTDRGRIPRSEQGSGAESWDRDAKAALAAALPHYESLYPLVLRVDGTHPLEETMTKIFDKPHQTAPSASWLKQLLLAVSQLFSFSTPRTGAAVLMYHAVDDSGWRLAIPPAVFDTQMAYLATHTTVVPLLDVVAYAKGEKDLPKNAVALTFDDGFHDLVTTVLPILTKYQLPATLFLTTDLTARTNVFGTKRVTESDLTELMKSRLITIESHGRTHPHLPALSEEGVQAEIAGANTDLRARGISSTIFAYPYGDRAPVVEAIVEKTGYDAAFAITEGFVERGGERMHLPRIQVDTTMTLAMFKARLTGALTLNRALVTLLRP